MSLKRIWGNMEMSYTVLKAKGDTTSMSAAPQKFTARSLKCKQAKKYMDKYASRWNPLMMWVQCNLCWVREYNAMQTIKKIVILQKKQSDVGHLYVQIK